MGGDGSTCLESAAGSPGASWAGRQPGDISSCCCTCIPTSSPLLLAPCPVAGGCSAGTPLSCTLGGSHPILSSHRASKPSRTSPGERNGGTQGTGGALSTTQGCCSPTLRPADSSPCAHLAGDVTWRLGRGENLLPAPVQRRGLSLRDVHSHRGHRFPGETTTAASPLPPPTHTSARTEHWDGCSQPLHPK